MTSVPSFTPYLADPRGDLYRLQGIDLSLIGAPVLYLAGNRPLAFDRLPLALAADDWLGSGTLRNSLYLGPWAELSHVADLHLVIEAQGSLRVQLMLACPGRPAVVIREFQIDSVQRRHHLQPVGPLGELPADSRLFWHVDAIDGGVLHDAVWCTRSVPRPGLRMAVLMRTWGRSADILGLLRRWSDAAAETPYYAEMLARIEFWVLDSSLHDHPANDGDAGDGNGGDDAGHRAAWAEAAGLGLRLKVLRGPNLGGGGNASHLMQRFLAAQDEAAAHGRPQADEVLLLDDDLSLSIESLARYVTACAYRSQDVICSLPILMKSRPTVVWEDGGFWGRSGFHDQGDGVRERHLAPHLVRHGLQLDGYEHLDSLAPLNRCEYVTFIFFGLPLRLLRRIGLPAAFFLRGDDVELSMRAGALGVPVLTNPNLAAWHEPAHSHAQEYMAILHGVLINLAYCDDGVQGTSAWFEQRLMEHAAIGDEAGLQVYRRVIQDLLDPASMLLGPQFEAHYSAALPQLAQPAPMALGEALRTELAADPENLLLPFLYPGFHPQGLQPSARVLLVDASGRGYRELQPMSHQARLQALQGYAGDLLRLAAGFDDLRRLWRARLRQSGEPAFWNAVAARHQSATRLIADHDFVALAAPARPALDPPVAAAAPSRELRQRLEKELASLSRLRRNGTRPAAHRAAPAVGPDAGAQRRQGLAAWLFAWWPGRTGTAQRRAGPALPDDFNPNDYLALNADVARSGVDPVQHYLRYGQGEGRGYRLV